MPFAVKNGGRSWRYVDQDYTAQEGETLLDEAPSYEETSADIRTRLLPDLRTLRDKAMNVLDGIQADALATGDTTTALAIKDAKQACRDIPGLDVSAATSELQIRALYLAEWRRIAAMVPAGVRVAFTTVLA